MQSTNSTPSFEEFNPNHIPSQKTVLTDIEGYDYSLGVHEILLSGSAGSSKSLLASHAVILHCLKYSGATVLLGRRAMPDLKDTIFLKIMEHMEGSFVEGKHFKVRRDRAEITFFNGSRIISRSWADKNYKKMRSLELSMAVIEELTENRDKDKEAIDEIKLRVGRLPHVTQGNIIIYCTNPDSPSNVWYEYFSLGNKANRKKTQHVYYSKTADNPFLPESYLKQMKEDYDPLMYERMGLGIWNEIKKEVIYHQYGLHNVVADGYDIDPYRPIHLSWDFNIGLGKPLSIVIGQFVDDCFHFYAEVIIEGADTDESCAELHAQGLLDEPNLYIINGDATGERKSTTSKRSDYDIIKKFFANHINRRGDKIDYAVKVPKINPPIRTRHNIVNSYCKNAANKVRLKVYKDCKILDKGMRLTALKEGARLIEDDSKSWQHCTTSLGYMVCWAHNEKLKARGGGSRSMQVR